MEDGSTAPSARIYAASNIWHPDTRPDEDNQPEIIRLWRYAQQRGDKGGDAFFEVMRAALDAKPDRGPQPVKRYRGLEVNRITGPTRLIPEAW